MELAAGIVTAIHGGSREFDRRADAFLDGIGAETAAVLCRELLRRYGLPGWVGDDGRRPLSEKERVRIRVAKISGRTCAACGRSVTDGEPVWMEQFFVSPRYSGRGAIYWQAPVGTECVSPRFRRDTESRDPERCVGCGRRVFYGGVSTRRRSARCARRCKG